MAAFTGCRRSIDDVASKSPRPNHQASGPNGPNQRLSQFVGVADTGACGLRQALDVLALPPLGHTTVAIESIQHPLMAQVLAPRLELPERLTERFAKLGQPAAEAVREVGQAGCGLEGLLEDRADG